MKIINMDIYQHLARKNVPFIVHWELTNRCNENCIHCLRDKRRVKELSLEEIKSILIQLKEEGCFELAFSGGEPSLRKDFSDILEFAHRLKFSIKILTNGTVINRDNIKLLKKIKPCFVQVSLYGISSQMHDSITRLYGSFTKTMSAIRLLKRYRIPFRTTTMCFNKNFSELSKLKKMGKKRDWTMLFDFVIFPSFTKDRSPLMLRATDEQLRLARRRRILTWACDAKSEDQKQRPPINLFERGISISANGDVNRSVLLRIKLGNLRKSSFHDIWHNSPKIRWFRRLREEEFDCYYCRYYNTCCRLPEMAYLEQGNLFIKPQEICRINNMVQGKRKRLRTD